jgi:phage/plasmid-like protein (TIGR03299 family)
MAHLVYQIEGEASMAYANAVPWHGLGQNLPAGSNLDVWAQKAHLEWTVEEATVQFAGYEGFRDSKILANYNDRKVLFRSDTGMPLEVVSRGYNIVQPIEVLEFYRDLVDKHGFIMETAGSLDDGRRVWALAKAGDDFRIMGQDVVQPYLMFCTSFDKTLSTTIMPTSIRVVCNNTLSFAYDDGETRYQTIKVPHSRKFDADKVKIDMGLVNGSFLKFAEYAELTASTKISKREAVAFFVELLHQNGDPEDYSDVFGKPSKEKALQTMVGLFDEGAGAKLESANESLWGAINAVTAWVDHEKPARTTNNRFKNSQFGEGAALKAKAQKLADHYLAKLAT